MSAQRAESNRNNLQSRTHGPNITADALTVAIDVAIHIHDPGGNGANSTATGRPVIAADLTGRM